MVPRNSKPLSKSTVRTTVRHPRGSSEPIAICTGIPVRRLSSMAAIIARHCTPCAGKGACYKQRYNPFSSDRFFFIKFIVALEIQNRPTFSFFRCNICHGGVRPWYCS